MNNERKHEMQDDENKGKHEIAMTVKTRSRNNYRDRKGKKFPMVITATACKMF